MDRVYSGRAVGALVYLPLGLYCLAVVLVTPFWMPDPLWYVVLVCLPLGCVTAMIFANAYAAWASRIRIRDPGLEIHAPRWGGSPLPPVTRIAVPWSAVTALRHRTEIYRIPFGFPVPVYAIDTTAGRAVFGGRYGLRLDEALRNIATMANVPIADEGVVEAGMIASLRGNTPPWGAPPPGAG